MSGVENFEFRVHGTYLGEDIYNIFHYSQSGGTGNAAELLNGAVVEWKTEWLACVHASYVMQDIEVINLDDAADWATAVLGDPGTANATPGGELPSSVTWTFKKNRTTRIVRNGYIRLCGITEGEINGNTPTAAALTKLTAFADKFENDIVDAGTGSLWNLSIRHLPTTALPTTFFVPVSAVNFLRVGSQNSRKP